MARKNSLEGFIKDLKYTQDILSGNDSKKVLEKLYDKVFALLMVEIGKRTAYDTGVARQQIKEILDELGASSLAKKLDSDIYEFWKTREQREKEGVTYEFYKEGGRYNVKIIDYGFSNQADGKVSDIHPRQDKLVIPRHVDYVVDEANVGANKQIEKILERIENRIFRALEKGR